MTSRGRRLVARLFLVITAGGPLGAQQVAHLGAGAGAGGSVFGWQPRIGMSGDVRALSLGAIDASLRGEVGHVTMPNASLVEVTSGVRLSTGGMTGWWLGTEAVRRNGFKDAVERPRIETGGWHRIGNVVITISATRRSARLSSIARSARDVESWNVSLDSITGHLDSTRVVRTVRDSSRVTAANRWAETEAGLAWASGRFSAALTMGGRLASGGVPRAAWASADVAVRLAQPIALVVGAGNAAGNRFALDAEHRYLSLGVRLSPTADKAPRRERPLVAGAAVTSFAVDSAGAGRYRFRVIAPRASRVEVSGDFTAWKPLSLARDPGGEWTAVAPLTPGAHRVNVRVDAGRWIAPPGMTTMNDDFAGEVGVLVIDPGLAK